MPSDQELAVTAFFFATRAARKKRSIPGADRIAAAIHYRIQLARAERAIEDQAERDALERGWD